MAKRKRAVSSNGDPLTFGVFNAWKSKSFDPHIRKLERTEEHVLCLKREMNEVRRFILPPAADSLEVQADPKACHTSPLADLIRSTIRADTRKLATIIVAVVTFTVGAVTWGIENGVFKKLVFLLIDS